jgi:hypothetical protein
MGRANQRRMTKMGCLRRRARSLCGCVAFVLCTGVLPVIAAAQSKDNSMPADSAPLQEVTVTAHKQINERTLDRVIIPRFVQSHGVPNPRSHQVGRWTRPGVICPSTVGLKPAAAAYLSRRIISVAASVGAPTTMDGHCKPTVEIIFTANPQEQVSYFGKTYRTLLGYDGGSLKDLVTFSHQIRAWYTTATHTYGGGWSVDSDQPLGDVEAPGSASRLGVGMVSGFVNVLVIVDTKQISGHSLRSIADYIAMLVLTRTSVDGCSELPSIIDLLSADCTGRPTPDSMTPADIAYLKALYSADLEKNLNLEQGDMHYRMSREVLGR